MINAFAVAVAVASTPTPGPGFCGPAADTAAIQALLMTEHHDPPSTIMTLAVSGEYGEAHVEISKGPFAVYYRKTAGRWHADKLLGDAPYGERDSYPASWPKSAIASLITLLTPFSKACANPHYVHSRGEG